MSFSVISCPSFPQRWLNLWKLVPNLDIDDTLFLHGKGEREEIRQSFVSFVDNVLATQSHQSPIKSFTLKCTTGVHPDTVNHWISNVAQRVAEDYPLVNVGKLLEARINLVVTDDQIMLLTEPDNVHFFVLPFTNYGGMKLTKQIMIGIYRFSPIPISALSGTGTGELLDLVCSGLNKLEIMETMEEEEEENYIPAIAIIGLPNVGKSSILNALVREDRTIVSPVSGTTRDAIDAEFTGPDGEKFRLIDTAGIRKKAAVASSGSTTEAMSVNRAFRAIRRSDVVALVIEAMACITEQVFSLEQDMKIAERIEREGKGCLVVVNKWDTIPNKNQQTAAHYEDDVREKLRSLKWAPIVYSTAITGHSVDNIVVAAATVQKERSRRLSTATLNQVIREPVAFKSPPRTRGGKRGRVYYCTQAAIRPPTFVFFVNDAKLFSDTYRRYMEKQLRTDAGFAGTPIRLLWRSRKRSDKNGGGGGTMRMSSLSRERKLATKG
ncbi:hypothetical protein Bca101_009726 [Brassica carinata]